MIGKFLTGINAGGVHGLRDVVTGELIINAPTDVVFIRTATVTPPRILLRFRVQPSIGVAQGAFIQKLAQPRALFGQKAGVFQIAFPVFQVKLVMRDINVAANDDFTSCRTQRLNVG